MSLRVIVTGGTGSIGRRLVPLLAARGHRVDVVSRRPREARRLLPPARRIIAGDCACPGPWQEAIAGADAVVHLAGAGVAERRWSRARREEIERSRVEGTFQVVQAIEAAEGARPSALVCASATGFYGDLGEEVAHERFPPGKGFLADVCVRWEAEARKAEALGVRTARMRMGVVLDDEGPVLGAMLPWFRVGLGAILGSGRQRVPWIHHRDCARALLRAVERPSLAGAVNVVAPKPCSQRELAQALGRTVGRPVFLRVPRGMLRLLKGDIAEELFISQRVAPTALLEDGFEFHAPSIERCFELLAEEEPTPDRVAP